MKKVLVFFVFFFMTFLNVFAEGNYVKSIKIDGVEITGFSPSKTEYQLNYQSNKENVMIGVEPGDDFNPEIHSITGSSGKVNLNFGENNLTCKIVSNTGTELVKYVIKITREDNRSNDNSLSSLTVGNSKVILGSSNEYNVNVDNKVTKIEVKPVLSSSKASFVEGFGERIGNNAVTLSGEKTSINIKVKAENGSIRDYKINIIKSDYKSTDASLKSLKIDLIDFNFKSNILEYELNVKNEVSVIKLTPIANDSNATIDYKEEITLKTGDNDFEIKVTAAAGNELVYKFKIIREEEIPLVSELSISGIDFQFDPHIYNYDIETELTSLDFNITLSSETATSEIIDNQDLKNGSLVKIEVHDGEKSATYSFKVINNKKNDSESKEIVVEEKVDFLKKNEMLIALAILGFGTLSLLIAIIVKKKK